MASRISIFLKIVIEHVVVQCLNKADIRLVFLYMFYISFLNPVATENYYRSNRLYFNQFKGVS